METKRHLIMHWIEQGLISKKNTCKALTIANILPNKNDWHKFIKQLMFWLGSLSLAFSLMFFIAYNWDAMGRFARFTLIEVAIISCVIFYWKLGADNIKSKILLLSASISLGVLLAFYGQTYQTGADPWQLFFSWALLMSPWVIISQFSVMWVIWLILFNISILLYYNVRGGLFLFAFRSDEILYLLIFIFNVASWITWEISAKRFNWLNERWAIRVIASISGFAITLLLINVIFGSSRYGVLSTFLYLLFIGASGFIYRKKIPDLFILAGTCLSAIIITTLFFSNILFKNGDEIGAFLFMTLLLIGMATGATVWLKKIHRGQQRNE